MLRKTTFCLIWLIVFCCLGLAQSGSAQSLNFKRQNLKVNGNIIGKMYKDVDGDSLIDIIVFYLEGKEDNSKRMVGFFKQQKSSGFDTIPNQTFNLDKKASVVGLSDVNRDGKKELLFLSEDGVYFYGINGGTFDEKPSLLFSAGSFLPAPEENVLKWDFCVDMDNKDQTIIIPQRKGYEIWTRNGQGEFVSKGKLKLKPIISISAGSAQLEQNRGSIHLSYDMPGLTLVDYNKDGKTDILVIQENKIYIFLSKEDGSFGEQADKVLALKAKDKENEQRDIKLDDINGDGAIDLIINESGGNMEKGMKSKTSIYLGKGAEGFNLNSLHQVISSEKEASEVSFHDLNKDGKKEMIASSFGFNVGSMIKVLLTKSLKFGLYVSSLEKNDIYPQEPNCKMKLSMKVSFDNESNGSSGVQEGDFSGDFNGDGLSDLFYVAGDNILRFFLGKKRVFFSDKPDYEMGMEIPADYHKIINLNNDNRSDIIFSFPEKKDMKNKLVVLFSKT